MTQPLPTLADRFAGVRQELLSGAGTPGFGLDAVILALVLRLLALLEGLAQGWASGGTVRRRRRPRRGFALARAACRLHKPNARTPSGARLGTRSLPSQTGPKPRLAGALRGDVRFCVAIASLHTEHGEFALARLRTAHERTST